MSDNELPLPLPAKALPRLVYGRLDPNYAPAVSPDYPPAVRGHGVDLHAVVQIIPGF